MKPCSTRFSGRGFPVGEKTDGWLEAMILRFDAYRLIYLSDINGCRDIYKVAPTNCSLIDAAKELFNSKIDMVRTDLIIAPSDLRVARDAAKAADASPAG